MFISAAARGLMQGLAVHVPFEIEELQKVLGHLDVHTAGQAVHKLQVQGQGALAKRVQKLAK
eukprot:3074924-Prorocentrum_lima.AAC.1